ncbi:MAG TPA: ABC transporter permease [Pyrinomonadaceae bacterium]|nr:ABC transporter permease [Pyrinomonadaceae bacterium]
MKHFHILLARLRALVRRDVVIQDIDEELRLHIELETEANIERGMSPAEARRIALRDFGNVGRIKDVAYEIRGGGMLEAIIQDIRYGARMLVKHRAFTFIAVLTLALGIGANTTIFSVVNAVLLRPLPYPQPERLVQVSWLLADGSGESLSTAVLAFWKENMRSFEEAAGYAPTNSGFNLAGGAEPRRARGLRVSEGFLRVLGVNPQLGRSFTPEEDHPNGPCATVISDGLWQGYFGGDASTVGRQVELNGRSCTVVGVLPAGFQFEEPVDLLLPLQLVVYPNDQGRNTSMIARIKQGTSREAAQAEATALFPEFKRAYPGHAQERDRGVRLDPYQQAVVGDTGRVLYLLSGAVAFVLLIACANVANLLLARGTRRRGEIAVRLALGASRGRLVRQLLTESLLLSLVAGSVGLCLALWFVPFVTAISPDGLPRLAEVRLDSQAVLFALAASAVTSLLFGISPALQATRVNLSGALKEAAGKGETTGAGSRMRSLLVVSEVALSLVLLVGAGLLIKSFMRLQAVQLGFDPNNLTTMQASLNSTKYRTTAQVWELQQRVTERLRALPGVESVATVSSLPLERGLNNFLSLDGPEARNGASVESRAINPDYFRTLGIVLRSGRGLSDEDKQNAPAVVVVNEALVRRLFPERDPLGAQIYIDKTYRQIVGVVADIREKGANLAPAPTVYVPAPQVSDGMSVATTRWFLTSWIMRTSAPVDLSAGLRDALREADPQLPVAKIRPMTEVVSASFTYQRFIATLMGAFAALALALTAVGLYGVLSYQVSQRTHEIGLRMALGAQARDVLKMIIRQGMTLVLVGVAVGLACAVALTRIMSNLMFDITVTDPATYVFIALLLTFVSLLACYIPARRATRVDPMIALRYD